MENPPEAIRALMAQYLDLARRPGGSGRYDPRWRYGERG